ncbi:MAG TPA: FAD-dependent oxidoreductase [Longimicrobium sp.]|nr:FAD-dependent oxidoreductase [Longimicrobium sp.]
MIPSHADPADRVVVIGFTWAPRSHEVRDFLARSRVPYLFRDYESNEKARARAEELGVGPDRLPLLAFADGSFLADPSDEELAQHVGLSTEAEKPFYDLVIVGAGPAGLAAAVYGASEGLRTVLIEREAPGGQAGMSAAIENYLGFPDGVSGSELAGRALRQAERFGAEVVVARQAVALRVEEPNRVVALDDGSELRAHAVLLALGVSWRMLEAPGCDRLIGRGLYYGAAAAAVPTCRDRDVYLLGAGNSAGQAALYLARYAKSVTMVAPEADFAEKMSEYLLERVRRNPNVHLRPGAKVVEVQGEDLLETITIEDVRTGERETAQTSTLFVYIGAAPQTAWLEGAVLRDEKGFVVAGRDLQAREDFAWEMERPAYLLETSVPGVFVAGDVRSGSVKRVGAAVGEGSMAIQFIHEHLRGR